MLIYKRWLEGPSDKARFERKPEEVGLADNLGRLFLAEGKSSTNASRQKHVKHDQETVRPPRHPKAGQAQGRQGIRSKSK